ncbi:hypothetical protein IWW50_006877, partial [Coemansia erecta]
KPPDHDKVPQVRQELQERPDSKGAHKRLALHAVSQGHGRQAGGRPVRAGAGAKPGTSSRAVRI